MSRDAPVDDAPARRMAMWLSTIAAVSAGVAAANVVRILGAQTPPRAAFWLGLMLAVTAIAIYGAKSRRAAVVWGSAGGVLGFVAIASGSIGVFFAPAALLLVGAGTAASIDERAGWRTLWIPIYFFAGTTAMAAVTLLASAW